MEGHTHTVVSRLKVDWSVFTITARLRVDWSVFNCVMFSWALLLPYKRIPSRLS